MIPVTLKNRARRFVLLKSDKLRLYFKNNAELLLHSCRDFSDECHYFMRGRFLKIRYNESLLR